MFHHATACKLSSSAQFTYSKFFHNLLLLTLVCLCASHSINAQELTTAEAPLGQGLLGEALTEENVPERADSIGIARIGDTGVFTTDIQTGAFSIDTSDRHLVRTFFNSVFNGTAYADPTWTGDHALCQPGTTSDSFKATVLARINYYRAMAGVPADIAFLNELNTKSQQAALMMSANSALDHFPPASWNCYTADGAEAASRSNLSLGNAGPNAVFSQMRDDGNNNAAAGHRRWILFPKAVSMGTGDVPATTGLAASNALWVLPDAATFASPRPATRDNFVAWPSPGHVPYQNIYPRWSFSYPGADFSNALVSMTLDGNAVAVTLEPVQNGAGENSLVWLPTVDDFTVESADETYNVNVQNVVIDGASVDFDYSVTAINPGLPAASEPITGLSGPASTALGQPASYSISPLSFATSHVFAACDADDTPLFEGAETGSPLVIDGTSTDYSLVTTGDVASGINALHLAYPPSSAANRAVETVEISVDLAPQATSELRFKSKLGFATTNQVARLEVSRNNGSSWSVLYEQFGNGSATDAAYQQRNISLSAFDSLPMLIRFSYQREGGFTYYPQTSNNVGWLIDDIEITPVTQMKNCVATDIETALTFDYTTTTTNRKALFVLPSVWQGYKGPDTSAVAYLTVSAAADTDNDGIADDMDNCTLAPNPDQRDTNGDGYGNVCDADLNNDGAVNFADLGLMRAVFFTADPDADLNGDGAVNFADLGLLRSLFFQPPGPSGLVP